LSFFTLRWRPDAGVLTILDQTRLPLEEVYADLATVEDVARAIETLAIRGAPAIGLAAAFGVAIAARRGTPLPEADRRLRRTRPTAVNLFWALDRMRALWGAGEDDPVVHAALAQRLYDDDVAASRRIARLGAELLPDGARVLTHCNAGALATAELGTALAVIRGAVAAGKRVQVYADETRPVLQGARLTAWELARDGVDVTVVPDGAVAHLAGEGLLDCAVTGADRIAANGDAANKIGTRGLACILHAHGLPTYVAAPWSTVDLSLPSGAGIVIEERPAAEVTHVGGVRITPEGVKVRNPAFDVTPAAWIAALVTDRGVARAPLGESLARMDLAGEP
jgi:methylthioribose-1-phosphate isomerase